jgi:hypothetical protein
MSSANTTLIGTPRTPLDIISSNRRITTVTLNTGGTKTIFGSDSEHTDAEMTQGEPKRICTTELDLLQPCETVIDQGGEVESAAESAANGGSEMSRATTETKSSGSSASGPEERPAKPQRSTNKTSYE